MGYPELVRALEEEVERQIDEAGRAGARAAARVLDEARAQAARERTEGLAVEDRRRDEEVGRVAAEAKQATERSLLIEMRRLLDEAFRDAAGRLPPPGDAALVGRLVDEILPEIDGEGEIEVEPGDAAEVERRLAEAGVALRVVARPIGGGVRVVLGTRRILDNTLRARLERARAALEPEIARLLFGEDHAGT